MKTGFHCCATKGESTIYLVRFVIICKASKLEPTVKVAGVVLCLQLGDEFSFLPQEAIPVKTQEEGMLLDLRGSAYKAKSFFR